MDTMSKISQQDERERLSLRNSLLVWVFGAVLGWAVAVVAVYGIIRSADEPRIAEDGRSGDDEGQFDRIAPAAGEPGGGEAEGEPRIP